ncbi:Ribonuclease Y [hydrothermal vent metagenome]|uniref:Ribonuclease Y n=1 Tax=hydrothermal vent metagenome TaxID=652676 RepID=A0A3B1DN42_9ZZZZ
MNPAFLVLAQIGTGGTIGLAIVGLVVGAVGGVLVDRWLSSKALRAAKDQAREIIGRAEADAKNTAEKLRLDAEKDALLRKEKHDAEIEASRAELRKTERRLDKREDLLQDKEEALGKRDASLSKRDEKLRERDQKIESRERDVEEIIRKQTEKLHELAHLSEAQAIEMLLLRVEEENRHEVAKTVRQVIEGAEEEAKDKATEITLMAIQRIATEVTSESTVRTVPIPSDDMKGRIIGREGRNIRAIERATGVDIIVDDTPGVIIVSCFDKVRQAVAVEALEKLIADGRMHPTRIEEVVEKTRATINERITKYGKEAALEVNIRGLHPKIIDAMGRMYYRTSYGQNVLRHSVEVAYLSQLIAEQLGLDGRLARRCGFLHDIGKAMDHEMEGGHPKIGMDFARQHGERDEAVLNAIGGHHADIPATTFYTPIIMAADAVSSARPGARRESMERYIQRLNDLQDIALSHKGVTEAYAIQAGREVRVMIDAERVGDDEAFLIAHDIAKRVADEMTFPGEIKVTVLRETRAIEFAR